MKGPLVTLGEALALVSTVEPGRLRHATRLQLSVGGHHVNHCTALASGREAAERLAETAPLVDHLFIGEDEARAPGVGAGAEEAGRRLLALGAQTVVVKRGAAGARGFSAHETVAMPGVPVHVVDPVGAGDAFAAGYLAELLGGHDLETRMACAVRCGAHATTALGDWEALPYRQDPDGLDLGHEVLR